VIDDRCHQDSGDDGERFFESRREQKRQQLRLVTNFRQRDDTSRGEQSFHDFLQAGETRMTTNTSRPTEVSWSKVLPSKGTTYAMA